GNYGGYSLLGDEGSTFARRRSGAGAAARREVPGEGSEAEVASDWGGSDCTRETDYCGDGRDSGPGAGGGARPTVGADRRAGPRCGCSQLFALPRAGASCGGD